MDETDINYATTETAVGPQTELPYRKEQVAFITRENWLSLKSMCSNRLRLQSTGSCFAKT